MLQWKCIFFSDYNTFVRGALYSCYGCIYQLYASTLDLYFCNNTPENRAVFCCCCGWFGICMQQCCSSSNTLMFLNEGHIWNAGQCTTTFCPAISCHFYLWIFMNIQLGHRNEQKITIIFFLDNILILTNWKQFLLATRAN